MKIHRYCLNNKNVIIKENNSSFEVFIMHYEVKCTSCKRTLKLYDGEEQYKQYKERKSHLFYCEDCKHKIRFDAIKNFFRNY
ncbi:DUF2197 domain-containing protein [Lysinibacillus xylanilyticus]|uniref:DUF2197 domain-containing protein n=1 Tax=Lysinibacillus xylanilyticus TaxID=582475 RepID=UPI0036DEA9C4